MQLVASEDVPGDNEAEVSRLPGTSQSGASVQSTTCPGTGTSVPGASVPGASQSGATQPGASVPGASQSGATHPGASVPGASHDRASVEDLLRELKKERCMRIKAERAVAQQKRLNLTLRRRINNLQQKFTTIFNRDQIDALGQKNKGVIRWGNETVKKAIQIRFTAGATEYRTLQKMKIPLPDIRTLG